MRGATPTFDRGEMVFAGVVFTLGLAIRIHLAYTNYLNADEIEIVLYALGTLRKVLHNSLYVTHPPMMEVMTWLVCKFTRNELALRLAEVLAGSFFPLLLFVWLRRLAGRIAAMAVLLLGTLLPCTIALSAQLRPYTFALFFVSACLLTLDLALESGRWQTMAFYGLLLWLCVLADYSTAWFVGAAGVYVLLHFRRLPGLTRLVWIGGQVVAAMLYAGIFLIHVALFPDNNIVVVEAVNGWLKNGFPQSGETLAFPFTHSLAQFQFLTASARAGWGAAGLFAAALFLLWTGRTPIERSKARRLGALLVLPFLFGIAGAFAHQFPYGPSRHTIVLGMLGVVGIAILAGTLPRRVGVWLVWGMLPLSLLWAQTHPSDDIPPDRHRKAQILQCLDYMRTHIPSGSLIFSQRHTLSVLAYYAGIDQHLTWAESWRGFSEVLVPGTWRVSTRDYYYATRKDYQDALAGFRRQYALSPSEPVWVLDGGWDVVSGPPDPGLPFSKAIRVFQDRGLPEPPEPARGF